MVKATISNNYRWRLGLIGLLFTGFGFYCLYDGFIAYPDQQRAYETYVQLRESGQIAEWPVIAAANGWSADEPDPKSDMSIYTQFIMAALVFPIGAIFGIGFIRSFGRWVAMDEAGLTTGSRQQVPFSAITSLDSDRWKSKGIAVVHYRLSSGQDGRIVLDDWKFDREATAAIYQRVHQHLHGDSEPSEDASDDASDDTIQPAQT